MQSTVRLAAVGLLLITSTTARAGESLDAYFQTLAFDRYESEQAANEITLASACGDIAGCVDGGGADRGCSCYGPCSSALCDCRDEDSCAADDCGCCDVGWNQWLCYPAWTVRAGAIFLHRERPKQQSLLFDGSGLGELFNSSKFEFGTEAGFDGTIMRTFAGGRNALEARYFGVNDWAAMQSFTAPANWNLGTLPQVSFAPGVPTGVDFRYKSNLNNVEVNWRHKQNYYLDWLAGFRFVQLDESLRMTTNVGGPVAAHFDTRNNLYGGQGGFDLRLFGFDSPYFFGGTFKAGVYGNDTGNDSAVTLFGTPILNAAKQRGIVAFVGEIMLAGGYRINRHVAVRGGYELLWLDNVALAAEQIPATNFSLHNGLNASGDPFYHGALTSLDITW